MEMIVFIVGICFGWILRLRKSRIAVDRGDFQIDIVGDAELLLNRPLDWTKAGRCVRSLEL